MTYSAQEQQVLDNVKQKVHDLFASRPDKVHGFDHAERVAAHAAHIAREEGEDVFMSTLAGWLHDIGRAIEGCPSDFSTYDARKTHHELSYDMLRDWFRDDIDFSRLSDGQKIELLYAVRYHWNDEANEYASAYILRDADKIDGLGEIGFERHIETCGGNEKKYAMDMRLRHEWLWYFKTATAKAILQEEDLFGPFARDRERMLKEAIMPVEL